jgi:AcrR family transcriptional regulator
MSRRTIEIVSVRSLSNQPVESPTPLRADAARNVRRILETASRVLADDQGAGMAEVAEAAGLARATLYRHFPSREELVRTILAQAYDEFETVVATARLDEDPPLEALRRLIDGIIEVGDRYRFLLATPPAEPKGEPRRKREDRMRQPVLALIERAERRGELGSELTPLWATQTLAALIDAALHAINDGQMTPAEATAVVYRTFTVGFS